MKFGALTVVTAEGEQREFGLELASVLIGRGEGCTINIDDVSIARRHARLALDAGNLFVEDLGSANGTFVAGQRIPPNTPSLVEPWEELRFGALAAFYQPPAAMHAEPTAALAPAQDEDDDDDDIGLPQELAPSIRATLTLPPVPVDPGSSPLIGTLLIQNRGRVVDELSVEVMGVPREWVRLSTDHVVLVPDDQAEVTVVVQPPRDPTATAGDHELSLAVTAAESGRQVLSTVNLTIVGFDDTAVSLHPVRSRRHFRLDIENRGNSAVIYNLSGSDDEEAYLYQFDFPSIEVPAGERRSVQLRVRPRKRPWFGRVTVGPFHVLAQAASGTQKGTTDGQLLIRPPLQPVQRPALFALIGAAFAVGILAYFFWPFPFWPFDNFQDDNTAIAASPEAAYAGVHMCDKDQEAARKQEAEKIAEVKPGVAPYFSQNDPQWGAVEYAKAKDPDFTPDWCGTTIEQCGCAMTSVTTIMALFQLVTMPDGSPLNPQTVNDWFNREATKTAKGWVSQGYVYGDVIWTAVNQLSAEIAKTHPGTQTLRFARIGTGSEEEIRTELSNHRPIILEVPGHWIAAVGLEGDKILINDPYYRDRTTLDAYAGKVKSSVLFEPSNDLGAVVITAPSNVRIKVTDKQGRVVGTLNTGTPQEAATAAQQGIPGGSYSSREAWRDPSCIESPPPPGAGTNQIILSGNREDYTIEALDVKGGATSVAIHSYDQKGEESLTTKDNNGGTVIAMSYDPAQQNPTVQVIQGATPTPDGGNNGSSGDSGGGDTNGAGNGGNQPAGSTTAAATTPGGTAGAGTPTPKPTATPSPTLTPTPVVAPAILTLVCQPPVYQQAPKSATVSCTATVDALSQQIDWLVNGATVQGGHNKTTFTVGGFDKDTSFPITITACNQTACTTKSTPVNIAFPPPGATPTPSPTSTGGPPFPTGTPQPPAAVQVSCSATYSGLLATVSCHADVSGVYSSITWDSGVAPTHLEGGSADYAATVNTADVSHFQVRATVCNGTSCTESAPADVFLASSALSCTVTFSGSTRVDCAISLGGSYSSIHWQATVGDPPSQEGGTSFTTFMSGSTQETTVSVTVCDGPSCAATSRTVDTAGAEPPGNPE